MHEQKIKDLLSSTCQVSSESVGLGIRSTGVQYSLGVTLCYWIFLFSRGKASGANIGIVANFVQFVKTLLDKFELTSKR